MPGGAEAGGGTCAQVHGVDEWPVDQLRFPGGQPVSLDRENMGKLQEKRYWVTWKADGTRYMLLLCRWGVYLIDRTFSVRRVQVQATAMPHRFVQKTASMDPPRITS